jgi:hypothetical protein
MTIDPAHTPPGGAIAAIRRLGLPPHRCLRSPRATAFAGDPSTTRQTIRRGPIGAWWVK